MNRTDEGRTALIAAGALAALYVAGALSVPALPGPSADEAEVHRYFVAHADAIAASSYLLAAALVPLLVFLAAVRRRLLKGSGVLADTWFAAGILLAAGGVVATMIQLGLALRAPTTLPATARSLLDVAAFYAPVATAAVFTLAASAALSALRDHTLPRWAGLASAAYAVYELLESLTISGNDGAFGPGGTINAIGTALFLVWAIVIGAGASRPTRAAVTS